MAKNHTRQKREFEKKEEQTTQSSRKIFEVGLFSCSTENCGGGGGEVQHRGATGLACKAVAVNPELECANSQDPIGAKVVHKSYFFSPRGLLEGCFGPFFGGYVLEVAVIYEAIQGSAAVLCFSGLLTLENSERAAVFLLFGVSVVVVLMESSSFL